jgi:signal transduction histidine kinase
MLADYLESHKQELVRSVDSRAASVAEDADTATGRHARIDSLVEELIGALRHQNGFETTPPAVSGHETALLSRERELVRLDVIEEVTRRSLPMTLAEMAIVSDWTSAADRSQLRDDRRRLCQLLDDVDEGAMVIGSNGRVEYINQTAAHQVHDATGARLDQIVGKAGAELGVPAEHPAGRRTDDLVALARRGVLDEAYFEGRWNESKVRAIYTPGGEVAGVTLVSRDIHERKLTQVRLKLLSKLSGLVGCVDYGEVAEALARVPIPELADWCIVNLVEGSRIVRTFIAQSDPAKAALRDAAMRAAPEWIRHPLWVETRLARGFQLLTDVSDDLLRKLAFNEEQYRIMSTAGFRSVMVQPVASRGRTAALITLVYTTDSQRRYGRDDPPLAEELALHASHIIENARLLSDLRASEARFRASVASARTIVYEQDTALRYVWYYNPIFPLSLTGKTQEESYSPEEARLLAGIKQRVLDTGQSLCKELSLTLGDEPRVYSVAIEPLRDHAGKIVGIAGSATDITEEKQTQRRLHETLDFRNRMMGILGHDLRNPLNAVAMAARALLKVGRLSEEDSGKARLIQRATERMMELIATLLDVTRVESLGRLPVSPLPTDLGARAREVVDEARASWPDRTIDLELRGDLFGSWDPGRMAQAISNLIANALRYGDPARPTSVSVEGKGSVVVLKVRNEGPPISADLIPVLFEPFSRGSADLSPQGLGLGLYIVKQIAVAHDATIDVESNNDVTVFTMLLPRRS